MKIEDYNSIKRNMSKLKFHGLENIDIGNVLTIWISDIDKLKTLDIIRNILSIMLMSFTISYSYNLRCNNIKPNNNILFYYSHIYERRRDYQEIFNNVTNTYKDYSLLSGFRVNNLFKRKLNFKSIKNLILIPSWFSELSKTNFGIISKTLIIKELFDCKRWYDYLVNNINPYTYKALITFFDARSYDNILTQYFKLFKIPTATLQHGHFCATRKTNANNDYIGIAFEGFISDMFFVWGEYTKREAIKNGIDPNQVQNLGNPKYIGFNYQPYKKNKKNTFGIILDGGNDSFETNAEMIGIANMLAKKRNLKYILKPHPISNISNLMEFINSDFLYRIADKDESVQDYSETVDFSIAMGSSVYSELIFLRQIVYRYVSNNAMDKYEQIEWGIVRTPEDIIELYDILEKTPDFVYKKTRELAELLFAKGNIAENYYNAILKLVNSNKIREM